ncbi:ribonuclease domain-containing protein [Hafnia paralvei]|uniref:ribonuclease domain-containing protein n=1 Tax=Hafnia paralvei TaxID=546367 RepID=UPI001034967A|nr:ribonuclease domain-containing protein [Hafnia paralvei]TBL62323.1 ribonuclease N [Hafnia paralvei]
MAKRLWTGLLIIQALSGVAFLNSQAAVSSHEGKSASVSTSESIEQLTQQDRVVSYLREHQRLPDFYITKKQARAEGWDASAGNLCSAVPGRAIGGDRFSNREKRLPQKAKRVWREADINYHCGRRQADRLIYSNDGLIYITRDHYRTFTKME